MLAEHSKLAREAAAGNQIFERGREAQRYNRLGG